MSGGLDGTELTVAIAISRFNEYVTRRLLEHTLCELRGLGVCDDSIIVARSPGAFELPWLASRLARRPDVDAVICLGAVIEGETPHFEHVATGARDGISRVSAQTGKPVIFGVLTTHTADQAVARSGHGAEYARAAVEMANIARAMDDI